MPRTRANGEGSIVKRVMENGRTVYDVTVSLPHPGLPNGKRKTKRCKTNREAQAWLHAQKDAIWRNEVATGEDEKFAAYVERWLVGLQLRPKTVHSYTSMARRHILPHLGHLTLQSIKKEHLQALYKFLATPPEDGTDEADGAKKRKPLGAHSIRHVHNLLSTIFASAVDERRIGYNPCQTFTKKDRPRFDTPRAKALDEDQVARFLIAAKEDPFEALWLLALTTGLRQGELLGLRWSDINLKAQTLTVERTLGYVPGQGLIFGKPKSKAGERTVALASIAVQALMRQKERVASMRAEAKDEWEENGLVFPNRLGKPMRADNLRSRQFSRILEKAGLEHMRFHELRHTVGTMLTSQGQVKLAQEILGHSTPQITLAIYSHVLPGMQRGAIDQMEATYNAAIERQKQPEEGLSEDAA